MKHTRLMEKLKESGLEAAQVTAGVFEPDDGGAGAGKDSQPCRLGRHDGEQGSRSVVVQTCPTLSR